MAADTIAPAILRDSPACDGHNLEKEVINMNCIQDTYTLSNGVKIPCLGYGTWKIPDGEETVTAVAKAIELGYRHVDTARAYRNEAGVGRAVRECGLPRDQIFVTSKLHNSMHGYELAVEGFETCLKTMGLDYLDMYLIHWPVPKPHQEDWRQTLPQNWRMMEEMYRAGKIRAIGVCNCLPHHLEVIMEQAEIKPMVNQIELHPGYAQQETVDFCRRNGILVEGWGPMANGKALESAVVKGMAEKYGRSISQICLRWVLQKGFLPLSKTTTPSRMEENQRIFDFELSAQDMAALDAAPDVEDSGMYPDSIWF